MKIEKNISSNTMTVKLEGRLDTNTVQDLENEVSNYEGIDSIIFDFENLEYISSSGLRFILKCKKTVENTKVINCSSEVFEIFNITGFSEMMEVEKALRKISIDGCEKIGEGFFGIIYRLDPETIVKVYKVKESLEMIQREISLAKKAFVMGIPTAIPYDIVKVGDTYGAVFELLNAKSLVKLINNEDDLDNFAKNCTNILKDMHSKEIKEGELPSRKQTVLKTLEDCKKELSEDTYSKLKKLLEAIPESNHLLHCDFHVKNIMMQNDELILIDMDTLSVGNPIFEFASIYSTYVGYSCIDKENTDKFLGMPLSVTSKLFDKIFRYYYSDKTDEELQDILTKISVITYLQVLRLRTVYTDKTCLYPEKEREFCKNFLNEQVNKLDTLLY